MNCWDREVWDWLRRQQARYVVPGYGALAVELRETGEIIGQCGITMQDCAGVTAFALDADADQTLLLVLFTAIFIAIQYMRRKEGELYRVFVKEPVFVQVVILALAVCICVFSAFSGSFEVNTQFIYFDFYNNT